MRTRILLLVAILLIMFTARPSPARSLEETIVPSVFSSPINGGCYLAGPDECRIHVDPFAINVASGSRLVLFQIYANGQVIHDFRTDVSNPPPASGTTYSPSLVGLDYGAKCGQSYVVNILGRDSLDSNSLNMGQTATFT